MRVLIDSITSSVLDWSSIYIYLNHPEAGIPVGVGPAKDAPAAPVVDLDEGKVK